MSSEKSVTKAVSRAASQIPADFGVICDYLKEASRGKNFFPNRWILEGEIAKASADAEELTIARVANSLINLGIILNDDSRCYYDGERARQVLSCVSKGLPIPPPLIPRLVRIAEIKKRSTFNTADGVFDSRPFAAALGGLKIEDTPAPAPKGIEPEALKPISDRRILVTEGYDAGKEMKGLKVMVLSAEELSGLKPFELDEHIRQLDYAFGRIKRAMEDAIDRSHELSLRRETLEEQIGMLRNVQKTLVQKFSELNKVIQLKSAEIDTILA
jgi:hypothetical protein